jgi:hypothetical protein
MNVLIRCGVMWLAFAAIAQALPNSVFGGVFAARSPLDGVDLTRELLAAGLWEGAEELPGEWREEGRVATQEVTHLLARPHLFGREVLLLRANRRGGALESLEATFVDAGSYFGYFNEELPSGLGRRERQEEIERRLRLKQAAFSELYDESLVALRGAIGEVTGDKRPKRVRIGHTRTLRAEPEEWRMGELSLRLLVGDGRLVRLMIQRAERAPRQWLDDSLAEVAVRERLAGLASLVRRDEDGTVRIDELRPIPQGFQPYCGLNTLAMAARHLGMHLDEDWLAVAGEFQNTGSAQGSNMVRLYHAVASEAGLGMDRKNTLDVAGVRRAIDRGLPVIVWRRFCHERNALHDRHARDYRRGGLSANLPDPAAPSERASWPGADAPLHASVVVGYHAERRELLFLESWSGRDLPRRMRAEEMVATTYLSFVFTP